MTNNERELIEKLAREAGFDVSEGEITVGDYGNRWDVSEKLQAFAEAYARATVKCKYGNDSKSCTSSPMDCQCALDATLQTKPVAYDKNKIRADVMWKSPSSLCKAIDYTMEAMEAYTHAPNTVHHVGDVNEMIDDQAMGKEPSWDKQK